MKPAVTATSPLLVVLSSAACFGAGVVGCGADRDASPSTAAGGEVAPTSSAPAPSTAQGSEPEASLPGPAGSPQSEGRPGEGVNLIGNGPGSAGGSDDPSGAGPGDVEPQGGVFQGDLPLVYADEDTGADCPEPALPAFAALPSIPFLPDPFLMSSGERMTSRAQWRCRRAELRSTLEAYDVGEKPGKPQTVEASLEGDTLHIDVSEGTTSFTMSARIERPANAASGPIPAIIGVNAPTGALPASIFSSRGIATITYDANQLAPTSFSDNPRTAGNFFAMYPGATAGYMVRWAWGVSRIIDALEQLPEANIDVSHLAVSGCSFQGKIALYAGALDERIALTIPHESGGGGTISWRYSDLLERRDNTEVENLLHAQGAPWYAEALRQFNTAPDKLPFDHHELMALTAPRALLAIESTAIARMGAEAARVDALGAREVWTALGVPDRMGASEENTPHCVWHDGFTPDLEAYVDKFLLGKPDVNTDILRSRFSIDTDTWIPWSTPALE
jgi:hypothetical protein